MLLKDYKLTALAAVVILIVSTVASTTLITVMHGDPQSLALLAGIVTPSVVALLSVIRGESTAKDVGVANSQLQTVQEKINGHLEEHTQALNTALEVLKEKGTQ